MPGGAILELANLLNLALNVKRRERIIELNWKCT